MPNRFDQRTAAPAKDVNVPKEWVTAQPLLHLQS